MTNSQEDAYQEFISPLTNSRGFNKLLRFDYQVSEITQMPLVVSPHVLSMGTPYYTRQGLDFLSNVESAIRLIMQVPNKQTDPNIALSKLKKAADDCLFEYSLNNPDSQLTVRSYYELPPYPWSKTYITSTLDEYKYLKVDGGKARLDSFAEDEFNEIYSDYIRKIYDDNMASTGRHKEMDAYPEGLTLEDDQEVAPVKFTEMPYTYKEVEIISKLIPIDKRIVPASFTGRKSQELSSKELGREIFIGLFNQNILGDITTFPQEKWLEQEIIKVIRTYDPLLLDFYFAGLRSLSPLVEFKNYYNIIEYFFESSEKENQQIREVINKFMDTNKIKSFLKKDLSRDTQKHFQEFDDSFGGKQIQRLRADNPDLLNLVAERLYTFRNSIFHSKRTYRGQATNFIGPFSNKETEIVKHEVVLIKMVAQEIIKQSGKEL